MNSLGAALLTLSVMLVGCSQTGSDPILSSLARLRESTRDDAFVVVEDPATRRYVQFSVFPDRQVHFDFPVRATFMTSEVRGLRYHLPVESVPTEGVVTQTVFMSQQEIARLRSVLSDHGLTFSERCEAGTYFDGPIKGYMESIDGVLPARHDARAFVDNVFTYVFRLAIPEKYTITEN
jgi:hypothetical protein